MIDRGVAQSVICPRCAAEMPPAAARFVTCSRCKLSFDTAPKPKVMKRLFVRDRRVTVSHAPDRLTLRYSRERGLALVLIALSLGGVVVALLDHSTFERQLALCWAVVFFVPVPFAIMPQLVTVDANEVRVRVWPFRGKRLPRADARRATTTTVETRRGERFEVNIDTLSGKTLTVFDSSEHRHAKEVEALIDEALGKFRA